MCCPPACRCRAAGHRTWRRFCETRWVASAVGGIPEVVKPMATGLPWSFQPGRHGEVRGALRRRGQPGGRRPRSGRNHGGGDASAVTEFGWHAIAERTVDVYWRLAQQMPESVCAPTPVLPQWQALRHRGALMGSRTGRGHRRHVPGSEFNGEIAPALAGMPSPR